MSRRLCVCATVIALCHAGGAVAGGLWLNEFGDFSGGRAAAGAAAGVDEAITIVYNPASITSLEGSHLFAAGGAYVGKSKFKTSYKSPGNDGGDGGDAGTVSPFGAFAYVPELDSEHWSAGIALGGMSGAGLDYDDSWAGRYQATDVSLLIMALSPTVAYRVNENLSVGASLQAVYADLDLDFAVPGLGDQDGKGSLDGDDVKAAYALGVHYERATGTRFGLFYQSEIDLKVDGDAKINVPLDIANNNLDIYRDVATDTELTMAQYVRFSVHQDMNERWGVDVTFGWDNWSALDNVLVSTDRGSVGIPTEWQDTWHYAWGAQYKLDQHWDLTSGVSYDSSPVKNRYRNAQLPFDRTIRYAFGARYKPSASWMFGGYINYMDLGKSKIEADRFGGDFDENRAIQIMANFSWIF